MIKKQNAEYYMTIPLDGALFECGYIITNGSNVRLVEVNLVGSKYELIYLLSETAIAELEENIETERAPIIIEDYDNE